MTVLQSRQTRPDRAAEWYSSVMTHGVSGKTPAVPAGSSGVGESPPDDRALVRQALAGERAAFDALVRRHQKKVFRIAFGILRSSHDAEDAVQEVFFRAYRYLRSYDPGKSFEGWLMAISLNQARELRHRRRAPASPVDPASEAVLEAPQRSVGKAAQDREMKAAALQAVCSLPERQREAMLLYLNTDLTTEEIGENLGCSRGAAGAHLSRARATLRRVLGRWLHPRPSP
jgi:RNA polymerase sigma-70 factor (ECF subfamily)